MMAIVVYKIAMTFALARQAAGAVEHQKLECPGGDAECMALLAEESSQLKVHLIQKKLEHHRATLAEKVDIHSVSHASDSTPKRSVSSDLHRFHSRIPAEVKSCVETWVTRLIEIDSANTACNKECGSIFRKEDHFTYWSAQITGYVEQAIQPSVKTVCETGFYLGESAALWLCANPDVHVYTYDLMFPAENLKLLQDAFPGRITAIEGDSVVNLKTYAEDASNPFCDIMVVDGGHMEHVPWEDLHNFAKIVAREPDRKHVLMMDELFSSTNGDPFVATDDPTCCMTGTYEIALQHQEFDSSKSRCVSFEGEEFSITGNTTLKSTYPLGGWCELRFDAQYLSGIAK